MSITEIAILIFAVLVNTLLLGFVYLRNPKSATHRLFALLTLVMSLWSITNFFAVNAVEYEKALLFIRGVMFFAVPFSVTFFLLAHTFPRSTLALSRKSLIMWVLITVVTMIAAISSLVFPEVTIDEGRAPQPLPGIGLILFAPVAIGTIPLGFYFLIKKLRKASGIEKTQIQFLLIGAVIMYTSIIFFNFISVIAFKTSELNQFGPLFTLPFTLLAAYTIVRHRLLDIRAALFKGLSLLFLVGSVLFIYGILLISAVPGLSKVIGVDPAVVAGAVALLSIPVAQFIQEILTKLTDKFLFQNRADYGKALVEVGQNLSGTIHIEDVTLTILQAMKSILRTRKAAILLQNPDRGTFEPRAQEGINNFKVVVKPDNPLIQHLRHKPVVVVKDELALEKEREQNQTHVKEITIVEETLIWLDMKVIVPLYVNKQLTGLLLLGEKLSGGPYSQDDVAFLEGMAPQAATALENARLYEESLKFGERLKDEVRRATSELEKANVQLRNLDKAKSEFLSIASHQLRTPLTAVRGYVSMLEEGDFGKVPDEQKPILEILEKSASRLIDLINNLLDISRIESGRLELNLQSVDLVQMAEELVRDLLPNAITKNLILEFHAPKAPIPHVVVDGQRVRQVMLNFVDNAIKYTPTGRIDVRVGLEGEEIVFSVQDTGKGISKEDVARLFHKFTRVGGASRFHTEGTGLGLYVARQIVQEHHGEVFVDSPGEGKGSTFAMSLPVEGSAKSLKVGEKATVVIKAAEAQGTK